MNKLKNDYEYSLSIGITTAGRPTAIKLCLDWIDKYVEYPNEIVILDNTPHLNSHVSYDDATTVLCPSERIGPGESRMRIARAVDTDLLLFLDDDTFPKGKTVSKLVGEIGSDYKVVSGIWKTDGMLEVGRECGRIFHWGRQGNKKTLIDMPVMPGPLLKRGFDSWEANMGLPTTLIHTDLLDSVTFDSRYDWYFEWLDFYLQIHQYNEKVKIRLDAEFEHANIPYSFSTIKYEQDRNLDLQSLLQKWDINMIKDAKLDSFCWEQSSRPDRIAARIYAAGGLELLFNKIKQKF
jgi:hypothetical protein